MLNAAKSERFPSGADAAPLRCLITGRARYRADVIDFLQGQRLAREASQHLSRDAFGQHRCFREDRGSAAGVEEDHIC